MNEKSIEAARSADTVSQSNATAYTYLVLTAFLWAVGIVLSKGLHETVPPLGMTFWRWFGASVILYPFVAGQVRRDWPMIRRNIWRFAILGFVIVGASAVLVFALRFTTAINGALLNSSQPALTVVVAWLAFRSRVSALHIAGLVAAMAGIVVMVSRADLSTLLSFDFNRGDLLILVATVGYSVYGISISRAKFGVSPWTTLFAINLFGGLSILPFYIAETIFFQPVPFTLVSVVSLLVLAGFVGIISIYFWNMGNRIVGHNRAAIFVNLLPVFGAALAIIFLGEQLFFYHLIGAALVIAGVLMVVSRD